MNSFKVIVCTGKGIVANACSYTRYSLNIEGGQTAAGFYQKGICMPMITTLKFDEFISSCISSCQTQSAHAGFCTTAYHSNKVHIRNHTYYQLRHFNFQFSWCTKRSRVGNLFLNGFNDWFISMTQNHGSPTGDVIDVLVTICIKHVCTFGTFHK